MLCFKHWATSHYLAQDQRRIWVNCYPDFRYRNCRVWYVEIKKKQREICHKQNSFYYTETKRMQRPIIWMLYTPHSLFAIFYCRGTYSFFFTVVFTIIGEEKGKKYHKKVSEFIYFLRQFDTNKDNLRDQLLSYCQSE